MAINIVFNLLYMIIEQIYILSNIINKFNFYCDKNFITINHFIDFFKNRKSIHSHIVIFLSIEGMVLNDSLH